MGNSMIEKKTKNDFISGNLKGKFGQYEILWPIRFGENSTYTIKITYLPSLSLSLYSFVCTPTSFDGSFRKFDENYAWMIFFLLDNDSLSR